MANEVQGAPFRPSANRERQITQILQERRQARTSVSAPRYAPLPAGRIIAKNDTGGDVAFADPGFLDNYIHPDTDFRDANFTGVANVSAIVDVIPTTASRFSLVAAAEPIAANEFGVWVVSGLAVIRHLNTGTGFYLLPNGATGLKRHHWGLCKLIHQISTEFAMVDLSCSREPGDTLERFTLTSGWTTGTATANFVNLSDSRIANDSGTLRDPLGIFASLSSGDVGLSIRTGDDRHFVIQAPCGGS